MRSDATKSAWKRSLNYLRKRIARAKSTWFEGQIKKMSSAPTSKSFFDFYRKITGKSTEPISALKLNDIHITDPQQMSNLLCKTFAEAAQGDHTDKKWEMKVNNFLKLDHAPNDTFPNPSRLKKCNMHSVKPQKIGSHLEWITFTSFFLNKGVHPF